MAKYREYTVYFGMNGSMKVAVPLGAIQSRGEREAVGEYAFGKLMGENELGVVVDKNSKTREFLMTETKSRYLAHRGEVYQTFVNKIKFQGIRNLDK